MRLSPFDWQSQENGEQHAKTPLGWLIVCKDPHSRYWQWGLDGGHTLYGYWKDTAEEAMAAAEEALARAIEKMILKPEL